MYHSVTFGEKNSWDDWYLIPTSRPVINPPQQKTNYVEIPGLNGILDLSESLTGFPTYQNRTGSIEFIVMNNQLDISPNIGRNFDFKRWHRTYSDIMDYLHGKSLKAILEDDKSYYYVGRFSVNDWKSDEKYSTITIDYDVYPFKKELSSSLEPWKWDPFDFETGIIRNYSKLEVTSSGKTLKIPATREYITPKFVVDSGSSGIDVIFKSKTYHLINGENIIPEIIIGCEYGNVEEEFIFKGTGNVSVDYRGGVL